MSQQESQVTIKDGYLYVGLLKVCRVNGQTLEFHDGSRVRRDRRGGSVERANVIELVKAVAEVIR